MRQPQVKQRIDWAALHATLKARAAAPVTAAAEGARAAGLLAERTRALATPPRSAAAPKTRVLMLRVGIERSALLLSAAREVIELGRPVALPGVSGIVLGIVTWRGEFVPVFDLALVLGCAGSGTPGRAVVLAGQGGLLALAVDAVEEVAALDMAVLQPADRLAPHHAGLFRGATPQGLMVIDETALVARLKTELQAA